MTHTRLHLHDVDRVHLEGVGWWRPIRRTLGVTGFGVNGYTADNAGDELIETHDETGVGAGGHEELYLVVSGRATFTAAGEESDAPAGTMLLVDRETRRGAVAAEPNTTVLVIGGKPGSALPVSVFEHWYAAQPAYDAGDYERAVAIASEGLADYPDHPSLHYQLACYEGRPGTRTSRASGTIRRLGEARAWSRGSSRAGPMRREKN